MENPKRKNLRHPWWNYHDSACYHLVLCAKDQLHLFGELEGEGINLTAFGKILYETVNNLERHPQVEVRAFVIMPNHIHLLIALLLPEKPSEDDQRLTIPNLVRQIKSITVSRYVRLVKDGGAEPFRRKIWQRSYYDRIVRNEREYSAIWAYIDSNPDKWAFDNENR